MYVSNTEEQMLALMKDNVTLMNLYRQYQQEVSFFLSRMTHDIKNPLTMINSSLQLMEKREPSLKELPYWNSVKADLNDLFALLDELRTFNYADHLNLVKTDLARLLMELTAGCEAYAKEKGVRLTITLTDSCHPDIDAYACDEGKLKEAILNLIKNAIEAAEENGLVSIVCSMSSDDTADGHSTLTIAISDTGETIAKEEMEQIFTPFYTTKTGGTGLGLPTVHKIIAAHGGQLKVTSENNLTTFIIYLPVTQED